MPLCVSGRKEDWNMERREQQIFREESKELNREDYKKLVREAKRRGNQRLYYLLQTLGTTGIRVSELSSITVEGLKKTERADSQQGKGAGGASAAVVGCPPAGVLQPEPDTSGGDFCHEGGQAG